PGPEYQKSRHNIGFMVADLLKDKLELEDFKQEKKCNSEVTNGNYNDERIIIAKPQSFMNLSGECVMAIKQFYKLDPQDIWIIYDDIDLPLGQIRVRKSGGPGTHNGMRSVIDLLGEIDFPRFRVGIESRGDTAAKEQDISSFVLSPFMKEEEDLRNESITAAADAVKFALEEGVEAAMNKYNG
ncbi:aminoacyl-tRNA hydrolase, partial [Pseudomonadota bacterium]